MVYSEDREREVGRHFRLFDSADRGVVVKDKISHTSIAQIVQDKNSTNPQNPRETILSISIINSFIYDPPIAHPSSQTHPLPGRGFRHPFFSSLPQRSSTDLPRFDRVILDVNPTSQRSPSIFRDFAKLIGTIGMIGIRRGP
jgi:hypothetical protein